MRHKYLIKWVLALVVVLTLSVVSTRTVDMSPKSTTTPLVMATSSPSEQMTKPVRPMDPLPTAPETVAPPQSPPPSPSPLVMPIGCEVPVGLSRPDELQAGDLGPRSVARLPRQPDGSSPVPPDFAKDIYAWDNQGGEIGDDEYKAYFTAHTYSSDDSALGNQLQDHLGVGGLIRVTDTDGRVICYEVAERVEVLEADYIEAVTDRPSQGVMVISVCSGLEGKVWTKRTIWFAKLVQPR